MDNIQILVNDYNKTMNNIINRYAALNSNLSENEFKDLMINHLNSWKIKLINLSNDVYADPMMRQVAAINLYDINSRLRLIS
jgi:hypothetical protein